MRFQITFVLKHFTADTACVIDSLFFTFSILNIATCIRLLGKFLLAVQASKHSFCFILNNLLEFWTITFPFVSFELLSPFKYSVASNIFAFALPQIIVTHFLFIYHQVGGNIEQWGGIEQSYPFHGNSLNSAYNSHVTRCLCFRLHTEGFRSPT